MDKITVGIYDKHILVQQGIESLLQDISNVEIVLMTNDRTQIMNSLRSSDINILIINIHELNTPMLNLIAQLNINFPKTRMLILSINNTEEIILKTIKAGAKGFLSTTADKNELVKSIYTIRSGHDYFSKSITHILLNKYITNIKSDNNAQGADINNLSSRQIEILKLWGDSFSNQEIADKLFISIRTVETHKNHIMQKLNLKTTVDMIKFAIKNNLIEI